MFCLCHALKYALLPIGSPILRWKNLTWICAASSKLSISNQWESGLSSEHKCQFVSYPMTRERPHLVYLLNSSPHSWLEPHTIRNCMFHISIFIILCHCMVLFPQIFTYLLCRCLLIFGSRQESNSVTDCAHHGTTRCQVSRFCLVQRLRSSVTDLYLPLQWILMNNTESKWSSKARRSISKKHLSLWKIRSFAHSKAIVSGCGCVGGCGCECVRGEGWPRDLWTRPAQLTRALYSSPQSSVWMWT